MTTANKQQLCKRMFILECAEGRPRCRLIEINTREASGRKPIGGFADASPTCDSFQNIRTTTSKVNGKFGAPSLTHFPTTKGPAFYRYPIFTESLEVWSEPDFLVVHRELAIRHEGCVLGHAVKRLENLSTGNQPLAVM